MNKKVRKKNQIFEYHAFSPKKSIKIIQDWLIKIFLIQWDIKDNKQKILSIFGKKLANLQIRYFLG